MQSVNTLEMFLGARLSLSGGLTADEQQVGEAGC
jgi:hypothetical protein